MKQTRFVYCFAFSILYMFSVGYGEEIPPDQSARIIQKQLQNVKLRGEKLTQERKKLEQLIQQGQKNLQLYSKTLQTYKYNLEEAQKVIDAAQTEMDRICKRNDERELLFYRCVYTHDLYTPVPPTMNIAKSLAHESISQAAIAIATNLFTEIRSELPRLDEMQTIVEERQAYQNRIITKYMPADMQKKERQEIILNEKENQIEQTKAAAQETAKQVEQLQQQLAAAQKKIEEIRRQQRLAEEQKKKKIAASSDSKTNPTPRKNTSIATNGTFASQRGRLPWPVKGAIIRPFGEFTHPQFKVTIKNPGIDLQVQNGAAISAVADGQIIYTGDIPGIGQTILIDHGNDYLTVYGNVKEQVVKNQTIRGREIIGNIAAGNENGVATFHFEIRHAEQPLNPQIWLGG